MLRRASHVPFLCIACRVSRGFAGIHLCPTPLLSREASTEKARENFWSFRASATTTPAAMPELPEVEAARRAIEENCIGKKIKRSIIADDPKVIDGVSPSHFQASLLGKTIVAAHRKGKNMWLQLDCPPFPSFQFGMAGAIYIKGVAVTKYKRSAVNDSDGWPSKYSKFFVELDDGLELSFTDKRRFAKVRLLENPVSVPPISELGRDALLEPMTIDELIDSLSKKKIGIKALLLDQSFISGIGNWIADDVLYQARIHPLQIASSLSKDSCVALHKCIKEVIEKAVEVGADSSQFPSGWIFHVREKKPGKAFVDGKKIEFITAGGRTTAYVPELQKLNGSQSVKARIKPRKGAGKGSKDVDSDGDHNEPESEEEENTRSTKSKGGRGKSRQTTKPPAKRKLSSRGSKDENDNSDNDDDDGGVEKKITRARKTVPAPRKSKKSTTDLDESDDSKNDDDDDEDEDAIEKKRTRKPKNAAVERKSKKSAALGTRSKK